MGHVHRLVSRALRLVVLALGLAPLTAGAITTNIQVKDQTGADYAEQLIVVDATTERVVAQSSVAKPEEEDKDRRRAGFWLFNLGEGTYYAKSPSGARSQTFEVRGPGPVNVSLTLESGAAAGAATAGMLTFLFDIEAGYQYTSSSYDSWSQIDDVFVMGNPLGAASRSFDIDTNGGHIAARIFPPIEVLRSRPFFGVTGNVHGSESGSGARFGVPMTTGLSNVDFDLDSSVGLEFGTRWSVDAGPVRFGFLPTIGFDWASGKATQTIDETFFIPNAINNATTRTTVATMIFGGSVQLFPVSDCGFYLFGGGGYRHVLNGGDIRVSSPTPEGSRMGWSRVEINDGWEATGGIGYEFDVGRLGF